MCGRFKRTFPPSPYSPYSIDSGRFTSPLNMRTIKNSKLRGNVAAIPAEIPYQAIHDAWNRSPINEQWNERKSRDPMNWKQQYSPESSEAS